MLRKEDLRIGQIVKAHYQGKDFNDNEYDYYITGAIIDLDVDYDFITILTPSSAEDVKPENCELCSDLDLIGFVNNERYD